MPDNIDYNEELRRAHSILDMDFSKEASDKESEPKSEETLNTQQCTDLANELLKCAADMREEVPKGGGASSDSETSSAVGEATGVSAEEMKRRIMAALKKKKEKAQRQQDKEEGEEEEEMPDESPKEAAVYEELPGKNTPPYVKEVSTLLSESPSCEVTEADLKAGLMNWIQKKKKGGKQ